MNKWQLTFCMLACAFSHEIITVNIITDKIVCFGYPVTFLFGCFNVNTSGIQLPGYLVKYRFLVPAIMSVCWHINIKFCSGITLFTGYHFFQAHMIILPWTTTRPFMLNPTMAQESLPPIPKIVDIRRYLILIGLGQHHFG